MSTVRTFNILDIDLDFFLNRKHHGSTTSEKRLDSKFYKPWTELQVRNFLEENCGLAHNETISGAYFKHHVEAYYFLRDLQEANGYSLKFNVDHVDAHGDFGMGDSSYLYISSELLHLPPNKRAYPDKIGRSNGLGSGNFLTFAIACQWISRLRYVTNIEWSDDRLWFHHKNYDENCGAIQLKKFSIEQMNNILNRPTDMKTTALSQTPLGLEPEVPFEKVDHNLFRSGYVYDFILLTQSPGFTPKASDRLIPIIQEYMDVQPN